MFGQLATNDFKFDENIDYADPLLSGLFKGGAGLIGESALNLNITKDGFDYGFEGTQDIVTNIFTNSLGNFTGAKVNEALKPFTNLAPTLGEFMTDFVIGTGIEAGENILGDEINNTINTLQGENEKE